MKIGVFDSGLGGLIITRSLISALPSYNYLYLGDTARVPYGNRSQETIYNFTEAAVNYLFRQDCQLVIIACNTASAKALRRIQEDYVPKYYPDRRVLGVLIPAAEEVVAQTKSGKVGIIATRSTVDSKAYIREIQKLKKEIQVFQQAAPLLVPLIENNALKYADPMIEDYLAPLLNRQIDTLVLGCTHYPLLKSQIKNKLGTGIRIISQDEIIPPKLANYLERHPEIAGKLSRDQTQEFHITDLAPSTAEVAKLLFGETIELQKMVF